MKADYSRLHSIIFVVMLTESLSDKFLPTVCVLRLGRISVFFFKRNNVYRGL